VKTFFRVCNPQSEQGLWYSFNGEHTGLIHTRFNFCTNSELPMPHDKNIQGWLSATDTLEGLWKWFTKEDIKELQKHGWFIHAYEVDLFKLYTTADYEHLIIDQNTSKLLGKLIL
jgi:hypothetical protein